MYVFVCLSVCLYRDEQTSDSTVSGGSSFSSILCSHRVPLAMSACPTVSVCLFISDTKEAFRTKSKSNTHADFSDE